MDERFFLYCGFNDFIHSGRLDRDALVLFRLLTRILKRLRTAFLRTLHGSRTAPPAFTSRAPFGRK